MEIKSVSKKTWRAITDTLKKKGYSCEAASITDSTLWLAITPDRGTENIRTSLELALHTRDIVINGTSAPRLAVIHPLGFPLKPIMC